MPAAELAVWLIPGYLALLLYLHAFACRQLYRKFVIAGVDGGKVYVEFTTPYPTSTDPTQEEISRLSEQRAILIPVKKIVTFAPFDRDLHQWFVERRMVTISFNLDEAPELASA